MLDATTLERSTLERLAHPEFGEVTTMASHTSGTFRPRNRQRLARIPGCWPTESGKWTAAGHSDSSQRQETATAISVRIQHLEQVQRRRQIQGRRREP